LSDFLASNDPQERAKVSKVVGASVMITTGVITSVAVADVVGLLDPPNFLDAADAITYTDTAADPGIYSGGLDHAASGYDGGQLHFGQDSTYVEPGDTIDGQTADSNHDPVQWSNGKHIGANRRADRSWHLARRPPSSTGLDISGIRRDRALADEPIRDGGLAPQGGRRKAPPSTARLDMTPEKVAAHYDC
jgi:plastocyanin